MHYQASFKLKGAHAMEKLAVHLQDFEGFLGLEELGRQGESLFAPPEGLEVIEFGTASAQEFADYQKSHGSQNQNPTPLRVYFDLSVAPIANCQKHLEDFFSSMGEALPEIAWQQMDEKNYMEAYQAHYQGQQVGEGFWVGPPWQEPPQGKLAIRIEPGMAFGTGDHPTTAMCLVWAEWLQSKGKIPQQANIIDVGAGSGVLSIGAHLLWPQASLFSTESDPQCQENFERSLELNRMDPAEIESFWGKQADLGGLRGRLPAMHLCMSNIYAEVLAALAADVKSILRPEGGYWLLSGLLEGKSEAVLLDRIAQLGGLRQLGVNRQTKDEDTWVSYLFELHS